MQRRSLGSLVATTEMLAEGEWAVLAMCTRLAEVSNLAEISIQQLKLPWKCNSETNCLKNWEKQGAVFPGCRKASHEIIQMFTGYFDIQVTAGSQTCLFFIVTDPFWVTLDPDQLHIVTEQNSDWLHLEPMSMCSVTQTYQYLWFWVTFQRIRGKGSQLV